ncbi:hypothetical protein HPB49_012838 [Dermacentor silvarum]|uniref:Uncharacterized protein n=1 Tax=Dermacentor silvarum TaxID=543639 RepID=A0ACB8C9D2_DERSI|nr:hypothetical protein HPB49_012838 [Dermacentor silvarum]
MRDVTHAHPGASSLADGSSSSHPAAAAGREDGDNGYNGDAAVSSPREKRPRCAAAAGRRRVVVFGGAVVTANNPQFVFHGHRSSPLNLAVQCVLCQRLLPLPASKRYFKRERVVRRLRMSNDKTTLTLNAETEDVGVGSCMGVLSLQPFVDSGVAGVNVDCTVETMYCSSVDGDNTCCLRRRTRCDDPSRSATDACRKVCNNCKCPRESHDVYHEEFVNVRDRIGIKASDPSQHTSKEKTLQEGYSWVPPGLSSAKIEEYFAQLPNHKVPRLGSPGEKYRDRQLIVQLPKQDLALAYCKFLERECHRAFEDFVNARNEIALDIGYVREALDKTLECHKCGGVLPGGELAVIAPKFGEMVAWHPACFVCCACNELLVDLTYCAKDGKLYCERHYAETLKPRCAACDEIDGKNKKYSALELLQQVIESMALR